MKFVVLTVFFMLISHEATAYVSPQIAPAVTAVLQWVVAIGVTVLISFSKNPFSFFGRKKKDDECKK